MKKFSTASHVLQTQGLGGLRTVLSDKGQALYVKLYARVARSKWVWKDHWWVGKLVEIRGNCATLDGCEFSLKCRAIRTSQKSRLFFPFVYEMPERRALERYLNPELPVVELGASIGVIACLTNKRLSDPRSHIVIEANPDLVPLLIQNRDRNGCGFSVLHGAIAYGQEEITFFQHRDFLCSSVQQPSANHVSVRTLGLRDVLDSFIYPRITLICDIEGAERDLIEHDLDLISQRIETLIIEIHEKILGEEAVEGLLQKLEDAGMVLLYKKWETYVFENSSPAPRWS